MYNFVGLSELRNAKTVNGKAESTRVRGSPQARGLAVTYKHCGHDTPTHLAVNNFVSCSNISCGRLEGDLRSPGQN